MHSHQHTQRDVDNGGNNNRPSTKAHKLCLTCGLNFLKCYGREQCAKTDTNARLQWNKKHSSALYSGHFLYIMLTQRDKNFQYICRAHTYKPATETESDCTYVLANNTATCTKDFCMLMKWYGYVHDMCTAKVLWYVYNVNCNQHWLSHEVKVCKFTCIVIWDKPWQQSFL